MRSNEEMVQKVLQRTHAYEKKKNTITRLLMRSGAAICCLCLVAVLVLNSIPVQASCSIVLDVNPSIEIVTDGSGTVQSVGALNEDAENILGAEDFGGQSVEATVEKVVGALVDQGYISQETNSVLVSVNGANTQQIAAQVAASVSDALEADHVEGAILIQTVTNNEALTALAKQYGISDGKAQLISQILAQNTFHTFEELAKMTIHELNLLRISYFVELDNTQVSGSASQQAYVGQTRAQELAATDSGIAQSNMVNLVTKLECRNGVMLYRVEFENGEYGYRYRINAVTGALFSVEKRELSGAGFLENETNTGLIGETAALQAALTHAEMTDSVLTRCKYAMDWVDGYVVYDISFGDGQSYCQYVLDARTGNIMQYGKAEEPRPRPVQEQVIGEAAAKAIALAKDGIVDGSIGKYQMQLTNVDGSYVYTLEYICASNRYTVQIAAADGSVLQYEKQALPEVGGTASSEGI